MFADFYKGIKVLVTGHTGFKGSWLCEWLLHLGADVYGYSLDPTEEQKHFSMLQLDERLSADKRDNIQDFEQLAKYINQIKPDVIFHLAAQPLVRLSYDIPIETYNVNVMGSIHVMEAVRQSDFETTLIMITTDKCYENKEWIYAYRENEAMGGHDPYSSSKGMAELAISAYRRSYFYNSSRVKIASARAGNVIGGGDFAIDRIIPDCIKHIEKNESIPVRNKIATRPWQHVLEPLSGYLWLAAVINRPELIGHEEEVYCSGFNFGPNLDSNRTVKELVETFTSYFEGSNWSDQSNPNALHEATKLNLSVEKAFHLLQWKSVWDFNETIEQTASWYKDYSNTIKTLNQIKKYEQDAQSLNLNWAKI